MRILLALVCYAVFAAAVGLFSIWPEYDYVNPDEAIISVAFSHAGQRVSQCRRLTQDELNELPPNMRKPSECPRGRHPVHVQLSLDGESLLDQVLPASGIWSDGKANAYERLTVRAGVYDFEVVINDGGGSSSGEMKTRARLEVRPGSNVVVSLDGRQVTIR